MTVSRTIVGDEVVRSTGAVLTVDLGAIAANWRALATRVAPAACAAVVKADAYGLGADRVAPALARAGCRTFFVAHAEEGVALRTILGTSAHIAVLHGFMPGAERELVVHGLTPVLSARWQIESWSALAASHGRALPCIIQADTGMARFGLSPHELAALSPQHLKGLDLQLVMSHLACADDPGHPANAVQRDAFEAVRACFEGVPGSLAASSGIFLGSSYHHDVVRPGAALFGIAPNAHAPNPMRPVVRLDARVVQRRDVPAQTAVGYGWTERTGRPSRLATVSVGYADGLLRSLSGQGSASLGETRLPIVGRVSMDSIVIDVTDLGSDAPGPGDTVCLIGPGQDVGAVARDAGTIGYEVLTALGNRFHRNYLEG